MDLYTSISQRNSLPSRPLHLYPTHFPSYFLKQILGIISSVLVPCDCHNKSPQTWCKTTEICSSTILEARALKSKLQSRVGPPGGPGGESALSLSPALAAGSLWWPLAGRSLTPVSAPVVTLPSLCVSPPLLFWVHVSLDLEPSVIQSESSWDF